MVDLDGILARYGIAPLPKPVPPTFTNSALDHQSAWVEQLQRAKAALEFMIYIAVNEPGSPAAVQAYGEQSTALAEALRTAESEAARLAWVAKCEGEA